MNPAEASRVPRASKRNSTGFSRPKRFEASGPRFERALQHDSLRAEAHVRLSGALAVGRCFHSASQQLESAPLRFVHPSTRPSGKLRAARSIGHDEAANGAKSQQAAFASNWWRMPRYADESEGRARAMHRPQCAPIARHGDSHEKNRNSHSSLTLETSELYTCGAWYQRHAA